MTKRKPLWLKDLIATDNWSVRNWVWQELQTSLPDNYRMLVQGPNKKGDWSVGVVRKTTPSRQVSSGRGTLAQALSQAHEGLLVHLENVRVANI